MNMKWLQWLGMLVFGTVVPLAGLWMMYDGLQLIRPGLGAAVVGVALLGYGFIVSRQFKP
jgi:hypothetical protein